ncbi:MAG: hypothetical protein AAGA50_05905 [Pseudomonadota bacterium]
MPVLTGNILNQLKFRLNWDVGPGLTISVAYIDDVSDDARSAFT